MTSKSAPSVESVDWEVKLYELQARKERIIGEGGRSKSVELGQSPTVDSRYTARSGSQSSKSSVDPHEKETIMKYLQKLKRKKRIVKQTRQS